MWICVVNRRVVIFGNCACCYPAHKVKMTARLVVGAAFSAAAKWLLTNHRTCGFVIYIDVASSICKGFEHLFDNKTVACKHAACEGVR